MNKLTQFLIKELLDEPKTVAIYGGGFKPPTKGHFAVAKKTLEDFPEIDELKIFVGGGVRDGITQDESIKIWEIYKNYLSPKVDIEPSVAPVKSVLGYAKENPDTKVYWILGAREGDEEDLKDIENRTKSLSKYPNLEVKVITTSGGISGTKTRAAIKAGDKELFSNLIPGVNDKEKEQIWDLVTPVIKEVGEATLKPYKWEEVDREGYFVYVEFTTDSETEYNVDLESTVYLDKDLNNIPALGVEFLAKPKGIGGSSSKIVVNKGEIYRVMATIVDIVKKYVKKSKAKAIMYSPSKKGNEDFGSQRDKLYKAFISKAIPGVTFEQRGEVITAILPNTISEADPEKGTGKKPKGSGRRLYTDEDPKDTVGISFKTKEDIVDTLNKKSFKAKSHARQSQIINVIHQRVRAAYNRAKDPETKARLKRGLDYIEKRREMSKKKTERLRKMKEASDPQAGTALPYGSGFAPIKEIYQFKVSDKNYDEEDNSLISVDYEFSTPDNNYRVEFNSGEYNPESKTFDVSFGLDKGYDSKIDTFQMTGEGNALSILKTIIDIIKDFTNRFEVNKLVINPTSEKRGKIYSMILKALPQDILNKVELVKETKTDPFGLNELAKDFVKEIFTETWNPEEAFLSLSVFMKDNGMNVTPLPKIKVISDDKENASHLLGKTAYYNPADKSITLYTFGRHPKDVLRSFAHEMVHHEQNLNGILGNINTTNTNEDGHLEEIEKEAYLKGNIMLRKWEDSIKNPIKEYILDIPKFNYPKTFTYRLRESLNEITLSKDNAVKINGKLNGGEFTVGNITYVYSINNVRNPYNDEGKFYNVSFYPKGNITSEPLEGKENYIKILSTMYKIIVDFVETYKPEYIGIASMDNTGDKNYHTIYAALTDNKHNRIPGYFRKDVSLPFSTPEGKGRFVVLKRKNV